MTATHLAGDALLAAESIQQADIVVGIPSFNNAKTISRVTRAAGVGLAKYFPQMRSVLINSDGGSTDGTPQGVLSSCLEDAHLKLHDAKDPGSDLSAMLHQVVGSVFTLIEEYEPVWRERTGSQPVDLFGFRYDVGLDPIDVNLDRMITAFRRGCEELSEVWSLAMQPETWARMPFKAPAPFTSRMNCGPALCWISPARTGGRWWRADTC